MTKDQYIDLAILILSIAGICIMIAIILVIAVFAWFFDKSGLKEIDEFNNEKCEGK